MARNWARQNRYWLLCLFLLLTIVAATVCGALSIGTSAWSYWSAVINREHFDLATINASLHQEHELSGSLTAAIDSLDARIKSQQYFGDRLQQLRALAVKSGISLTSFDQQESMASDPGSARSLHLLFEGKYYALGEFIAAVERTSTGLTIVDCEIVARNRNSEPLSATIVLLDKAE